jgi:hypothetical protein
MSILLAIAQYEGFYKSGSRAQRNNNPGNIQFGKFTQRFGAVLEPVPEGFEESARFAYFASVNAGWSCLRALLTENYIGMTVIAAFNKYAPVSENDTNAYVEFVCKETGLTLESVLTEENIG